jgi:hypothetical protein
MLRPQCDICKLRRQSPYLMRLADWTVKMICQSCVLEEVEEAPWYFFRCECCGRYHHVQEIACFGVLVCNDCYLQDWRNSLPISRLIPWIKEGF